ncbi:MAG: hypothetical protein Faunusvirus46_8 [Faunusvirus sp.]|jgi:hypothetical protein|uniref:Uncharacterized protein n=1 Tax=Faunusvirus sp. TaxID=2487766 RepID=A0A3G4ZXW3_9VIRU|nr:MAG: hypothetical protein Faunusvirus46_8 [Faunusvirus sp.]
MSVFYRYPERWSEDFKREQLKSYRRSFPKSTGPCPFTWRTGTVLEHEEMRRIQIECDIKKTITSENKAHVKKCAKDQELDDLATAIASKIKKSSGSSNIDKLLAENKQLRKELLKACSDRDDEFNNLKSENENLRRELLIIYKHIDQDKKLKK